MGDIRTMGDIKRKKKEISNKIINLIDKINKIEKLNKDKN